MSNTDEKSKQRLRDQMKNIWSTDIIIATKNKIHNVEPNKMSTLAKEMDKDITAHDVVIVNMGKLYDEKRNRSIYLQIISGTVRDFFNDKNRKKGLKHCYEAFINHMCDDNHMSTLLFSTMFFAVFEKDDSLSKPFATHKLKDGKVIELTVYEILRRTFNDIKKDKAEKIIHNMVIDLESYITNYQKYYDFGLECMLNKIEKK